MMHRRALIQSAIAGCWQDPCVRRRSSPILRRARPGDLPIKQLRRYERVINMKTAKALDITVPQSLLLRAGEVTQ